MSNGTGLAIRKTFPLDPAILGAGSAATVELGGTTAADVVLAVASNKPFPTRPNGVLELAQIALTATSGEGLKFRAGDLAVGVAFSAGVSAAAGVFDTSDKAISALDLGETPGLDLSVGPDGSKRYLLLRSAYQTTASVEGSHPVGAIGAFTFGASAAASGLTAVLHRFSNAAGAETVLKEAVQSWKLPGRSIPPPDLLPVAGSLLKRPARSRSSSEPASGTTSILSGKRKHLDCR